jgi:hypothetical protein
MAPKVALLQSGTCNLVVVRPQGTFSPKAKPSRVTK